MDGKKPIDLVSVVMTNYNRGEFITDQLNSILRQTYHYWELIIVDDCSTDGSQKIIQEFIASHKDKNIIFVRKDVNVGVAKNFERGLRIATGKYIAVCDSDDVWSDDKLEKQIEFIKKNNVGLVYSDLIVVDEKLNIMNKSFRKNYLPFFCNPKKDVFEELIKDNHVSAPTIVFDAKYMGKLIPFSAHSMQDYWIALIFSMFSTIGYLDEATVYYRQHNKNVLGIKNYSILELLLKRKSIALTDHIHLKKESLLFFKDLISVDAMKEKYKKKINLKIRKLFLVIESLICLDKEQGLSSKNLIELLKIKGYRELMQIFYFYFYA
ncbi:MAG TPA: glycosyltransferase [Candidatus Kapabacteria bacterium]|nr:glycosyltransferase [Candidatus Kapabacteria bacterium]